MSGAPKVIKPGDVLYVQEPPGRGVAIPADEANGENVPRLADGIIERSVNMLETVTIFVNHLLRLKAADELNFGSLSQL